MKTIGRLKWMSGLQSREYPDQRTGEVRTINWVELLLADGTDEFVGELTVRPQQNEQGQWVTTAPRLEPGLVYVADWNLSTNVTTKEGRERRFNKLTINRINEL